jgi:hypothetical protein
MLKIYETLMSVIHPITGTPGNVILSESGTTQFQSTRTEPHDLQEMRVSACIEQEQDLEALYEEEYYSNKRDFEDWLDIR